jgi:hypothetical protein
MKDKVLYLQINNDNSHNCYDNDNVFYVKLKFHVNEETNKNFNSHFTIISKLCYESECKTLASCLKGKIMLLISTVIVYGTREVDRGS